MNNRNENRFIRNLFQEHYNGHECVRHYNDLRTCGRRRVFKTWAHTGVATAWRKVLKDLQGTVYAGRWDYWVSENGDQVGIKRFQER